jgi:hypothetical protein
MKEIAGHLLYQFYSRRQTPGPYYFWYRSYAVIFGILLFMNE